MSGDTLPDYIQDNYGSCALGAKECAATSCLKYGWKGRGCPHWKTLGATTYQELLDIADKQYAVSNEHS